METGSIFKPAPPDAPPEKIPFLVTSSGIGSSPGPAAYSNKPDALDNVPKVHMHCRTQSREDINSAPYRDIGSYIGKGKKYTFKGRYDDSNINNTPGPDYSPPSFGSSGTKCYVHSKNNNTSVEITPGPSDYNTLNKLGSDKPKYTFHGPQGERLVRSLAGDSPGPAEYDTRNSNVLLKSPRFSIGNKFSDRKADESPGPSQYEDRNSMRPSRNKGLIHSKVGDLNSNHNFPGPADYSTQSPILKNVPRLFMHGRSPEKNDINLAPYQNTRKKEGSETPSYSMRSRFYQMGDTTPGVDYVPPPFGASSRKVAISPRLSKESLNENPGPGRYRVESPFGAAARKTAFHGPRSRSVAPVIASPGPAEYDNTTLCNKTRSPRFSMKGAKYDPGNEKTGEYVDLGSTLNGPRYTLSARPSLGCSYG